SPHGGGGSLLKVKWPSPPPLIPKENRVQYFDYTLAPERYLKDLRRLAEEVVKKQYHPDTPARKLAFTFTSLDLWLSSGGALPIEWRLPLPASAAPAAAAPAAAAPAAAVAAAPAAAETEPPVEPSPS